MKRIFRDTLTVLTQKEKKQFRSFVLLDVVMNIADIVSLALLLWIVQFYVQPRKADFLPQWLANKNSVSLILVFFVFFGLKNLSGFFINRKQYQYISKVALRLSKNNLSNYQHSEFVEFVQVDSSIHLRRIAFQPFDFCQYMLSGMQQIITQATLIFLTVIAIIWFNAKLFLLLLIILLPPAILVFYFIKKQLSKARNEIRSNNDSSFRYLLDALKGYVEGNIYNKNDFFMKRFIKSRSRFSQSLFNSISLQTLPGRFIEIFAVLGLVILIMIAQRTGSAETNSLLTVGAFMAAAYKIIPGIVKITNISGQMRAYEFSSSDFRVNAKEMIKTAEATLDTIQLKDVSFFYEKKIVLDKFNLSINKGDFIGITGRSGIGKTTILNLLTGFLSPANGNVSINGDPASNDQIKKFWPAMAYVRQQTFLIHDTIVSNIVLDDQYDQKRLQCALHLAGLDEMINAFSDGLNHVITENGKNISGGQQQRIALARALYKDADLVLLDEPFNELDETSEIALLDHFKRLSQQGKMIVLITHNKNTLSYCSKIISLHE